MLAAALAMTRHSLPDVCPALNVTPTHVAAHSISNRARIEALFAADQEAEDRAALSAPPVPSMTTSPACADDSVPPDDGHEGSTPD